MTRGERAEGRNAEKTAGEVRRGPRDDKKREKGDKFRRTAATFVRGEAEELGLLPIVVRTGINVGKKAREEG